VPLKIHLTAAIADLHSASFDSQTQTRALQRFNPVSRR